MTRDEQIEQLIKELCADAEPNRERVNLLKTLLLDKTSGEKLQLEYAKFKFIEDHRALLTDNQNPSPYWMDGQQRLGRRLLDCDENETNQATG